VLDRTSESMLQQNSSQDAAALEKLRLQIEAHEKEDASRSVLKKAVGSVSSAFVKDGRSLEELQDIYAEQQRNLKEGKKVDAQRIQSLITEDRESSHLKSEIAEYGSNFLKTGVLFMRGKLGLAGTLGVFMLDQIRPGDSVKEMFVDAVMGAAKGGLMKGNFEWIGNKPIGVAAKGIAFGAGSRLLELGLTRQTYLDLKTGDLNLKKGLGEVLTGSLNKTALASDVVTFGAAHVLFAGANRLAGEAIDKSPLLKTMFTGTTFGLSTGATGEIMRQNAAGEQFDLGKIVKRSLIQGGLDTLAAAPGGIQADPHVQSRLRNTMRTGVDLIQTRLDAIKSSFNNVAGSLGLDGGLVLAPAGIPAGGRISDFGFRPSQSVKHEGQLYTVPVDPSKLPNGSGAPSDKVLATPEAIASDRKSEAYLEDLRWVEQARQDSLLKQAIFYGRQYDVVGIDLREGKAILRDPLVDGDRGPRSVMKFSNNLEIKPLVVDRDEYYYDRRGMVYKWDNGDVLLLRRELTAVPRESIKLLPGLDRHQIALRDGPMGRDGRVELPDGSHQKVISHRLDSGTSIPQALRKEMAGYQLNQILGLGNGFPVTVTRDFISDGRRERYWVQAKSGQRFEDRVRELATELYGSNSDDNVLRLIKAEDNKLTELGKQIELAVVERLIYGDAHTADFVIVETPSGLKVQSFDLYKSFFGRREPSWDAIASRISPLLTDFSNQPLTPATLDKIKAFVGNYSSTAGQEQLTQIGLTPNEIEGVLTRSIWFVENGKFPRAKRRR